MARCVNDNNRSFKTPCGLELCPDCNFAHLVICNMCLEDSERELLEDLEENLS